MDGDNPSREAPVNLTTLLYRLQHVLIISTGVAAVVLAGMWSPVAGACLLLVLGLTFALARKRGVFTIPEQPKEQTMSSEETARNMVTHLLKLLTRVQVSFLCQDFGSAKESRSWLKKALPRAFQQSLDDLHRNLERARQGSEVRSVRLAQRIMTHREKIQRMEQALEQALEQHDDPAKAALAHPMIFVVTEHLDASGDTEPGVQILAGWDPTRPTLIPKVDGITFFSDLDAGKKIRGQADFDAVVAALPQCITPLDEQGETFLALPVEDPSKLAVRLDKVPLGFTIDTKEML